jgi:hypothetical protein
MKRTEPLKITLLRALDADGPQTSMQLTKRLEPYPGKSTLQQRNGLNQNLRAMARRGHTQIAGTVPTEYHNTPAFLWQITPEGQRYLAGWAPGPTRGELAAARQAQRDQARQAALKSLARQARDGGWSPRTPTAQRREISRSLRAQGMAYQWIGAVFGVSREAVRLDCAGLVSKRGHRVRVAPQVVPPEGAPGHVWARTRERAGAL